MQSADRLKIGEVATIFGITTRTIRYYEKVGILDKTEQTKMKARTYSPEDIEKLKFTLKLKGIGISLEEICEIVKSYIFFSSDNNKSRPAGVEYFDKMIGRIDNKINNLSSVRIDLVKHRRKVSVL
jgi:DNA-binding transcriptional MerR regulator